MPLSSDRFRQGVLSMLKRQLTLDTHGLARIQEIARMALGVSEGYPECIPEEVALSFMQRYPELTAVFMQEIRQGEGEDQERMIKVLRNTLK